MFLRHFCVSMVKFYFFKKSSVNDLVKTNWNDSIFGHWREIFAHSSLQWRRNKNVRSGFTCFVSISWIIVSALWKSVCWFSFNENNSSIVFSNLHKKIKLIFSCSTQIDFFTETLEISNGIKSEINYWINSLNEMRSDEESNCSRSTWLNEHFLFSISASLYSFNKGEIFFNDRWEFFHFVQRIKSNDWFWLSPRTISSGFYSKRNQFDEENCWSFERTFHWSDFLCERVESFCH